MILINKLISWIGNLIPTSNIICFNSFPDYSDNAWAIFRYFNLHSEYKYELIWLINDASRKKEISEYIQKENFNGKVVVKHSLVGFYYFFRCRYCFYTHGINESILVHQHDDKMICLWHGMPLKKIGLLDNREGTFMPNLNYTLASSTLFQQIMADCFGISKDQVLPIGQPRCDLLFEPTTFYEIEKIDQSKYAKIGIWLPTYRYSIIATEDRIDGTYQDGWISFLNEEGLSALDDYLQELNHLLLIKLHPMDKSQLYNFKNYRNIRILKPRDLKCQLYPLLGSTDYLLTDFSGVCIDYDILKKPMGFTIDNYESYLSSRGFLFDDVLSILPGPILSNLEDLKQFLSKPYYKKPGVDFNKYYDNQAAERLIRLLEI